MFHQHNNIVVSGIKVYVDFTRTEQINVLNHSESEGEGWYTVILT